MFISYANDGHEQPVPVRAAFGLISKPIGDAGICSDLG